ncbi:aldo/keto reductase [Corynebacterium poyangense]|uniref:Aldo/keto reductase n=1 Tax=Corynebacterium poyangense TaxID=2684405 RepID=A0A7H0SMS1_9CORY|nr:aldo/keto reductase [Corynebacterium poyangense]QNQ89846.1 aldo/keto reductase [Corynebacterium poyangense]
MSLELAPALTLNDGTDIPQLGLGTWALRGEECVATIRSAIEVGYRHFDTAARYGNEEAVGQAINEAIAAGDVSRDELFITSKVWNDHHDAQATAESFQESLAKLGLDYLDLFLVHWPYPQQQKYVECFEAIARLQGLGTVQSIGVANFYEDVLDDLITQTGIVPAVNQVELHPGFSQSTLREYHDAHGIITEAWSPLGRGILLQNPVIADVADQVGRSPAQVILRWGIQLGCITIPKSAKLDRLKENLNIFDFQLSEEQMDRINVLDEQRGFGRIFDDPHTWPDSLHRDESQA